jgi:hypothetical protein
MWNVGGHFYVVYFSPHDPPIPLMYEIHSGEELRSYFGGQDPVFDRKLSDSQVDSFGSMRFGTTAFLDKTEGDPWVGFVDRIERGMETQPWLNDTEVFALHAAAWLEGREVELWEMQSTDWWRGLNEAQRSWISLQAQDPSQATTVRETTRQSIVGFFDGQGSEAPDEVIDFITTKLVTGAWTTEYTDQQLLGLVGKRGQGTVEFDKELKRFLNQNELEVSGSVIGDQTVRGMFATWLGPRHPPSEAQMTKWTDAFRRNPEAAREELTNILRQQRLALFPEYANENLTYEDIAGPWRGFVSSAWGETPDETDAAFQKVLRLNDAEAAGQYLRKVGLKRGNSTVVERFKDGIRDEITTIGEVRNPV